ncbi:hypothetical protein H4S02_001433 [Coemansia sp. RSA 2611]|nr:hypothetical protein H4S02_001433 [Coemansia sp. RSA 2611]
MVSPFDLTAVSTQQSDLNSAARSPIFDEYTLSQPLSPFSVPPGNTASVSPLARPDLQQEIPELVNIPATHSISYQPLVHEPQPGSQIVSASTQIKPRAPRNKSKFKRFRNAFIYYVNDQRKLKNREFLQLMSARWKALSEEARQPYVRLAEEDKKRFNEDEKKFGKYESRQRRYNKARTATKHGTAPYPLPSAQVANAFTANPALLYGGYANTAPPGPNPAGISPLYLNLQKASPMSMAAAMASLQANNPYSALTSPGIHHTLSQQPPQQQQRPLQQQQQSSFLAPPQIGQRNSGSSNASSNDLSDLALGGPVTGQLNPLGPGGIPANAMGGSLSPQMPVPGGIPANALYQQPPSPGFMQVPTGVPISHALTEPVLYDNSNLSLSLSGNWPPPDQQPRRS